MRLAAIAVFLSFFGITAGVADAQTSGGAKKSATGAKSGATRPKNAASNAKTAATAPDAAQEKLNPNASKDDACVVEKDSYERLLKGMAAEARALDEYRRERGGASTQRDYGRCVTAFVQSEAFVSVMGGSLSNPGDVAKNGKKAEQAIEKKCGQDPSRKWSKDKVKTRLDLVEFSGSQTAGMSQNCYALFKEIAQFFCSLDKEAQDYAQEYGIELPGQGNAKWKFSKEHAQLIAPKCIDLKLGLNSIEISPSMKR